MSRPATSGWALGLMICGLLADTAAADRIPFSRLVDEWVSKAALTQTLPAGSTLPEILYAGAQDSTVAERLIEAADPSLRAMSDSLLSFLSLSEPAAHRILPGLYVIRDLGPPVDQRPPSWAQVRDLGVRVLRRVGLDPGVGRDVRAARELDRIRAGAGTLHPGDVGGLVAVLQRWWVDRGDDPALTHDPSRIPSADAWLRRIVEDPPDTEWQGLRMLADLDEDGLKTRLFLDGLDGDHHAFLAAECAAAQAVDGIGMVEAGIEAEKWDPERGELVGHRIENLRALAREILRRVTDHIPSGASEGALRNNWAYWWTSARYQARYWRDPRSAPSLAPFLAGTQVPVEQGGMDAAKWVREIYTTLGVREFVLSEFGPEQRPMVSDLIGLLALRNREEATAAGFEIAYRRQPLLPRRSYQGEWVAILWPQAQALMREMLERITGVHPPVYTANDPALANAFWHDWWKAARYDDRWYRDPSRVPRKPLDFQMPRARVH